MKTLTHTVGYVIYDDTVLTNNPSQQFGNWKRSQYNIEVSKPSGPQVLSVLPGTTVTPFSGTRSIGLAAGSTFSLALNPVKSATYRLTWDGISTFAGFRTARAAALVATPVTVTVNNNALVTFSSAVNISAIYSVGDVIFIPSTSTGDALSPFSQSNVGYWQIVAVGSTTFQATRQPGCTFNGVSETVIPVSAAQFQVFSSGPTLVGDTFRLTAGNIKGNFTITALTSSWIEFMSSTPLPLSAAIIVGTTNLTVFAFAKRWIRIESDNEVVLQFNGSSDTSLRIMPRQTLSNQFIGWFDSWGMFWSLNIINESATNTCNLVISTVE